MKRSLLIFLAAAALFADGDHGIPPRRSSGDYPARQTVGDVTLGAVLLSPAEAKQVFTADLDHAGYLVFEVAIYPENGAQADVAPDQFTLRASSDKTAILPTASPDSIVETMYKGKRSGVPQIPGRLDVQNSVTVGYETGGRRNGGGVYTGASTTVGVRDPSAPAPTSTSKPIIDRDALLAELVAREFPMTKTASAVAGYLYFPKPQSKPKNGTYELTYIFSGLNGQSIVLQVKTR